nr:type IV secretion system protein [Pseudomonas amygdali]
MSVLYTGGISIVLFILGGIPFLLAVGSTLLVIKAATTMLLALGPLFIAFALFDRTRLANGSGVGFLRWPGSCSRKFCFR